MIAAEEGIVKETLPGLLFRVVLGPRAKVGAGEELLAHLAGKMKIHNIRVLPGDRVLVEPSQDGRRGRIVRRL